MKDIFSMIAASRNVSQKRICVNGTDERSHDEWIFVSLEWLFFLAAKRQFNRQKIGDISNDHNNTF